MSIVDDHEQIDHEVCRKCQMKDFMSLRMAEEIIDQPPTHASGISKQCAQGTRCRTFMYMCTKLAIVITSKADKARDGICMHAIRIVFEKAHWYKF